MCHQFAYPEGQQDSAPLVAEGVYVQDDYISAEYTWGDRKGVTSNRTGNAALPITDWIFDRFRALLVDTI